MSNCDLFGKKKPTKILFKYTHHERHIQKKNNFALR